jgi:hypothetical protein
VSEKQKGKNMNVSSQYDVESFHKAVGFCASIACSASQPQRTSDGTVITCVTIAKWALLPPKMEREIESLTAGVLGDNAGTREYLRGNRR